MNWRDHILIDPAILSGKPAIKGTRISVELIQGWLAQGWNYEMLLESYPALTRQDILAVQVYAAEKLRQEC